MIGTQTYHGSRKRRSTAVALAATAVGAIAWAWWRPFRAAVDGDSMRPAYEREDWLVATRRGRVRVGSVVVIEHPGRAGFELIKRVAAVPPGRTDAAHGAYWVVGDNPDASTDSRAFGMIRRSAVRGVVRFRYGPPARAGMRPPPSPAGRPEDPPYGR